MGSGEGGSFKDANNCSGENVVGRDEKDGLSCPRSRRKTIEGNAEGGNMIGVIV